MEIRKDVQRMPFGVKKTYRLNYIIAEPNSRMLYYLERGPERNFVSEKLAEIPEDVEVPLEDVKEW